MKIGKSQWGAVMALGLTIVLLVACGAKETPTSAPPPTEASTPTPVASQPETAPTPAPAAEATSTAPQPTAPPAEATQAPGERVSYDTVFPLPDNVQNFAGEGGESQVNFQTSLSLDEAIEFYRQAFTDKGLTERTILTAITDTTFSMVFDGWPNGRALVIQGVVLGSNTNVNIRFEDV
jgi:hypothetical protein